MVNKKGVYGRRTGHTLRMGCVARKKNKKYCGEFGIFVSISGGGAEERQGIVDDFSNFVDDGEIIQPLAKPQRRRFYGRREPDEVFYSMNKHKRWELPGLLKESVSDLESHAESDYRVRVVERELVTAILGKARDKADVTSVTDSKTAIAQKKSKRQHAYETDLVANAKPKKQSKRARRRGVSLEEEEEEHDPADDLPVLRYEFCYPRSTEGYPWCHENQCDVYKCSGKQKSPHTRTLKKTKGERDKRSPAWHGCYSRADFHKLGQFLEDTEGTENEAEDETEQLQEARTALPSTGEVLAALLDSADTKNRKQRRMDRVFDKGCSIPNIASSAVVSTHPKGSAIVCPQVTPDIEDTDTLEEDKTTTDVLNSADAEVSEVYTEKPTVQAFLTTESLTPAELEAVCGAGYQEALCAPRVFRLDLSDVVRSQVREGRTRPRDVREAGTAQLLCEVGEETVIVDENGRTEECCNTRLSLVVDGEEPVDCERWGDSWAGQVTMTVGEVVWQTVAFLSAQLKNRPHQRDSQVQKKRRGHSLKVISEICKVSTTSVSPSEAVLSRKVAKEEEWTGHTSQHALQSTTCEICWSEICVRDIPAAFALQSCLHWFCRGCWENHVVTKVKQGLTDITCPEYKCTEAVDDTTLMLLLPARLFHQYQRRVQNVAVDSSDSLHWCRGARCGKVVSVNFTGKVGAPVPVRCACGSMWCTACGAEPHWPASCQQAQEHLQELKDKDVSLLEEQTYTAMTKKCPMCGHPMEKNGGCPHMVCICGTSFCWTCGQEYGLHYRNGDFKCPRKKYELEAIELDHTQVRNMTFYQQMWYKTSLQHRKARGQTAQTQTYKQANKLARKMVLYTDVQLFYRLVEGHYKHPSDNLLSKYMDLTKGAADLLMQMHLAAEFTAVLVSNSRRRSRRNFMLHLWRRMASIQNSITRIFEEEKPGAATVQEKLEALMHGGKSCLQNLHRLTLQKN